MIIERSNTNKEIHVKIGGDHGGESMKFCLEVANVKCPNSKDNTTICGMFDAKDSRGNLRIGLSHFSPQIDELQKSSWR